MKLCIDDCKNIEKNIKAKHQAKCWKHEGGRRNWVT